jgi:hypothetical protein
MPKLHQGPDGATRPLSPLREDITVTKRIAAVTFPFCVLLALLAGHTQPVASTPELPPLDKAWHFCACGAAVYRHFHHAPFRYEERLDLVQTI